MALDLPEALDVLVALDVLEVLDVLMASSAKCQPLDFASAEDADLIDGSENVLLGPVPVVPHLRVAQSKDLQPVPDRPQIAAPVPAESVLAVVELSTVDLQEEAADVSIQQPHPVHEHLLFDMEPPPPQPAHHPRLGPRVTGRGQSPDPRADGVRGAVEQLLHRRRGQETTLHRRLEQDRRGLPAATAESMLEGERHRGDSIRFRPGSDTGEMGDHPVGDDTPIAITVDVQQLCFGGDVMRRPQTLHPGSIHAGDAVAGDERADHCGGGGGKSDPPPRHALQLTSFECGTHRPWRMAEGCEFAAPGDAELSRAEVKRAPAPTVRAEGDPCARRQDQSTRSVHVLSLGEDGTQQGETVVAVDDVEVGRNGRGTQSPPGGARPVRSGEGPLDDGRCHQKSVCGEE